VREWDRFCAKVLVTSECWLWLAATNPCGYGTFRYYGRSHTAHRVAYLEMVGPVPAGLEVRHKCDNPPCVNPEHLEVGTHKDNMQDKVKRGRHGHAKRTHCPKGHEYDDKNTYPIPSGGRGCRQCRNAATIASRAKRRNKSMDNQKRIKQ
jgi:hypothetical protein